MTALLRAPVHEYMSSPLISIGPSAMAIDAEALIEDHEITALGVLDDAGALVRVLSRTDLLSAAAGEPGATFTIPDAPVSELMSPDPVTIGPDARMAEAARTMRLQDFHRLFVMRDGAPAGVVSTRDVMRAVADERIDVPAMEVATRDVVTVDVKDSMSLAVDRLDRSAHHGLVVLHDGWPVGTFSQLDALLGRARDPRTPVGDVMELRALALPAAAPLYCVARRALAMNVRRVVLVEGDSIVGLVSAFDFTRVV